MRTSGISRRDYERLSSESKDRAVALLKTIKEQLRRHFSLRFLSLDGRWEDLNPPRFLALPEDHYYHLIKGSRGVSPRYKMELLEKISEVYKLAKRTDTTESALERWLGNDKD